MLRKVAYYRSKMCILGNTSTGTFQGVKKGGRGLWVFCFIRPSSTSGFSAQNLWKSKCTGIAEKHVDVCDGRSRKSGPRTHSPDERILFTVALISFSFFFVFFIPNFRYKEEKCPCSAPTLK